MKKILSVVLLFAICVVGVFATESMLNEFDFSDLEETEASLANELMQLLDAQSNDLESLVENYEKLQEWARGQAEKDVEVEKLLDKAAEIITDLRVRLECAMERVQDAEEGALMLLDENAAFYAAAKNAQANINFLKLQVEKGRRGQVISFSIGAVGLGVGSPLVVNGIMNDNRTSLYAGIGVVAGTGLVWALGHYVFNFW